MQGVGVVGIQCKRLLAAKLGVEMPSGLHVAKAGLVERGDGCRPRTSTGRLRLSWRLPGARDGSSAHFNHGVQFSDL